MTTPLNAQPLIDWFFENSGAASLGRAVNLDAATVRRVLEAGLPQQLRALLSAADTRLGQQQLREALRFIPSFPSVMEALSMGGGALDLERAGQSLAATLLPGQRTGLPDALAAQHGLDQGSLRRLFDMTLPLLISRLGWRDDAALRFLPLVGEAPRAPAAVAIPTNAAVLPAVRSAEQTVTYGGAARRRGMPLWPLLLIPLLLLGGCWLLQPQNNRTTQAEAAQAARESPVTSEFAVTSPAPGANVSANGFKLEGTGPVGGTYTLRRAGQQVGTFTVGKDNRWNVDVLDAAAPAGNVIYTFRDASGRDVATLNVNASGPIGNTPVEVTAPVAGAEVEAGGFNITGTGQPGTTYTAFEDGTNIGTFTSGPDGTWSVDVPGPTSGPHTYTVLDASGNRVARLPVTVAAAGTSAECTDALNISLSDNETVSAPFRFGGRGSGKGYTVTVWRGTERIGTRDVTVTGDCTWSYASNPGGQEGEPSTVRYEVRPSGQDTAAPPAGQVTLTVSGSGTNFNAQGEYVAPTTK
ncbi:DUF937 domain-containing protein [Deinococcus fonticola]|uniref:DUF937 domain-containing protein n=1 Tax=Deinococcus fonticola TaxID=2528713 RepID=UPI0010755922|nr:DUF937 domain-containing protein [Deinococcus fonticola]